MAMDLYRNAATSSAALLRSSIVKGVVSNDVLAAQFEAGTIETRPARKKGWKPAGTASKDVLAPQGARSRRRRSYDMAAARRRARMYGADGHLPPHLRCWFTDCQRAVLSVLAVHIQKHKRCTLEVGVLARLAGVSVRTVQYTLALASGKGKDAKPEGGEPDGPPILLKRVEHRKGWSSDPNTVTIVNRDWLAWLRLRPKEMARAGCKNVHTTQNPINSRMREWMNGSAGRAYEGEEKSNAPALTLPLVGGGVGKGDRASPIGRDGRGWVDMTPAPRRDGGWFQTFAP